MTSAAVTTSRARTAVASALALLAGTGPVWAGQSPITLPDALRRAQTANERMVTASAAVQRSEIQLRAAGAAFRPTVTPTASGAFGRRDLANQSFGVSAAQKLATGTELRGNVLSQSSRNQIGTYYFTDTSIFVSQPLLRGFGREPARRPVDTAEAGLRDARRQATLVREQVLLQTAEAYVRLAGQQALLRVADRAVERAMLLRDDAAARLKSGRASRLDTLRAEQLLAQSQAGRIDAAAAVEDARDQLRVLMRLDADDDFTIDPAIPEVVVPRSESEALSSALANRSEIALSVDALDQAERALRLARNARRAQLDLRAGVIRQEVSDAPFSGFGADNFQFATYATFSMPLFDDRQDAEYRMALVDRDERAQAAAAARLQVVVDVRRAFRELARSEQGTTIARSAVDLAQQEVEVARLRLARGLSNNLDVVTAEANLQAAESRAIAADGVVTLARLAVLAATGPLDLDSAFK